MPLSHSSLEHDDEHKIRDSYVQLGLEPGATMHEVEAAYWRFAHELRGQSAMAPYNKAYEALAASAAPAAIEAPPTPAPPQAAAPKEETVVPRPPSKFGWPAH